MNDLKFAFRQFPKYPGFIAVAVLTLTLGIGANLAIFAAVDAILLRPLPLPDSERLVTIYHHYPKSDMGRMGPSIPDLYDRRGKIESFALKRFDVPPIHAATLGKTFPILGSVALLAFCSPCAPAEWFPRRRCAANESPVDQRTTN